MVAINNNAREVVLVRDSGRRIVGLVTDGDIRRGLLADSDLGRPVATVMTRNFYAVGPRTDRAALLDTMNARGFRHVPALDSDGYLVAVHFLSDLIGAAPKPNMAVIMAGGRGTRLRPYTERLPKPMVEVAGRPLLERIVLHLVGHGLTEIYLAVNYLAHVVERHFGDGSAFGCHINYLRESEPLGTGGALSLLPYRPEHAFFVLNGDQVMRIDLTAMLEQHAASNVVATIAAGPHTVQIPFAVLHEADGLLCGIEEKPTAQYFVNRGIYLFEPAALAHVPRGQEFPITDLFGRLIRCGMPVGIFRFDGHWLDVAAPADLHHANGFNSG